MKKYTVIWKYDVYDVASTPEEAAKIAERDFMHCNDYGWVFEVIDDNGTVYRVDTGIDYED